jgi:uncharacterized membrane protein YeaQ/YmgE (transglycosylase-associated protein family)
MNISGQSLLVILAVGIAAGWLAGQIVQGPLLFSEISVTEQY